MRFKSPTYSWFSALVYPIFNATIFRKAVTIINLAEKIFSSRVFTARTCMDGNLYTGASAAHTGRLNIIYRP
jgi:hypothetical protein